MSRPSDDPGATVAFDCDWAGDLRSRTSSRVYIGELDGRPIGAMQIIDPHREATHYWGDIEPNLRALDIWIGAAADRRTSHGRNRGGGVSARPPGRRLFSLRISGILAVPHYKTTGSCMTNRRDFMQGSLAASLLALSPGFVAALDMLNAPHSLPLHKVLFDARDAASREFMRAFAEQGIAAYALPNGNLTRIWRNELAAVWARAPAPLAGFTDANVLFCLEQLGRQYGLRVRRRDAQASGLVIWLLA